MNFRDTLKINNLDHLEIGGVDTIDLAKKYGTPLYVVDTKHVTNMCEAYSNALKDYYGNGLIAYASKAFSCKAMYRLINESNIGADVVSGGELYTADKAGFPIDKLIFHGNNKSDRELEFAVSKGIGLIVIDSYSEADRLNNILESKGLTQKVLIRVNPGVEAHTHHFIQTATVDSKFGFSTADGSAIDIINHVNSLKNLNLLGLHCHIGSQIFEAKSFLLAVEKMVAFYKKVKDELSIEFNVINLGGGFGIWYADGDKKLSISDYSEFVKQISEKLIEEIKKYNLRKPFLILEPGRSIIGEAGITLYTAGSIKHIEGVKDYVAIDGGMFDNPRYALYQAKYTVKSASKMSDNNLKLYSIAGKCCESGDKIAEDVLIPEVFEGDILAVLSTGAYNYSMSSNYNRNLIPPVVFVKDGTSSYAVKPQTFDDLIRNDL